MSLTDFLLARIAEDERFARKASHQKLAGPFLGNWIHNSLHLSVIQDRHDRVHIARHDPARVLAECEAKRRIVEVHVPYPTPQRMTYGTIIACETCGNVDDSPVEWPCETLLALGAVYADHTDYRQAWKP